MNTAARTHIDHIVGVSDHIQIVLNGDDSSAVPDQLFEHLQQCFHV
jgi:hypothetical protein